MSLAKVHRAAKARKEWTCEKCGDTVKVGEPVLSYTVGFRGREHRRCDKASCRPRNSELESSRTSEVYAAIEDADFLGAASTEELQAVLSEIAQTARDIASEYESSEMFDKNEDLQERAAQLEEAADELEGWEPESPEPDEDDKTTWGEYESFEDAHDNWRDITCIEAEDHANNVDLP